MTHEEFAKIATGIAAAVAHSANGDKAEARRMTEQGTALFWRLAAKFDLPAGQEADWMRFLHLVALLTPATATKSVHNPSRKFGAVLADGGNQNARLEKPIMSEPRLARLIASRGGSYHTALERAVRMIARTTDEIDVVGLAYAAHGRAGFIAKDFYKRFDNSRTEDVTND